MVNEADIKLPLDDLESQRSTAYFYRIFYSRYSIRSVIFLQLRPVGQVVIPRDH